MSGSLLVKLKGAGFDFYLVLLIGTVALASLLPARGAAVGLLSVATYAAVALLFFLYGARLDTAAIVAGISNLRLQGMVLAATFVAFPIVGLLLSELAAPWLLPEVILGVMYVALLPSTVQSSIAFTSIAGGNVPAAVCAASASNLLGVVLTPVLVAWFLHAGSGGSFDLSAMLDIGIQILLPFVVGQLVRPFVGGVIQHHPKITRVVDRGSILLIIYGAFSAGMVNGIWSQVDRGVLAAIIVIDVIMLAVVMGGTWLAGHLMRLPPKDGIVLLFCGSKKSLASGLPMANILFAGRPVGLIVLPLMLFHQIQLFACAIIAERQARRLQTAGLNHKTVDKPR